jgi:hypothetical protein
VSYTAEVNVAGNDIVMVVIGTLASNIESQSVPKLPE